MTRPNIFKDKFEILQELSNAIVVTDNISEIADLLLHFAINYAYAEKGSLMLLTEREELYILAAQGLDPALIKSHRTRVGDGIAGIVAQNRRPILVEDIDKENTFKNFRRDHYKTKSFICCPIVIKQKLLGILNINDKRDGTPFSADEFELAKTLSNQAAIALENTLLLIQLKSKAKELEDINKRLVETDILKTEFLTRVSHELRTPLNAVKGAIYYLQQTEQMSKSEQREFHGIVSAETDKLISIVENLLNFLRMEDESRIIRKSVINMNDVLRELLASKSISAILSRKGIQLNLETQDSLFDVVGDKIRAAQLFTNLIDGFSYHLERGDTIRIASSNNDHVTITISLSRALPDSILTILHNARYIFHIDHPENRFKFYLAKSIADTHRWKLLAQNNDNACDIILMIPRSTKEAIDTYVDRSMDYFVEFISELLDLDICSIMLSDELTNELTVKSAIGLDDDIVRRTRIKFGDSIAGWVALEGKPLFIKNIENDPRFSKKSISQYTTKSLMSLPLKIGDRVIGVLNLNNKKTSEPFTQRDYSIASLLSEKIASYLELLYSEKFNEEKIRRFIASLSNLVTIDKVDRTKSDLLSGLTDKILKSSPPLK